MKRRTFLGQVMGSPFAAMVLGSPNRQAPEPSSTIQLELNEAYFPDAVHKLIWRNWDLVPLVKVARLLAVEPAVIERIAASMGLLEEDQTRLETFQQRNRFAVIKRNWLYLPNHQLCRLLDMTEQQLQRFLLQDIAFLHIVGPKPDCPEVTFAAYRPDHPGTTFIREAVRSNLGPAVSSPAEHRFAFIEELSRPHLESKRLRTHRLDSEQDLSGWTLVLPPSAGEVLRFGAEDFVRFMEACMEGQLGLRLEGEPGIPAENTVRVALNDPQLPRSGSYRIESTPGRLLVSAADEAGAMYGLFFIEELMEERGAPFLPLQMATRRETTLAPRIVFPYFSRYGHVLDDDQFESYYPAGYLARMAHLGINGIWLSGVLGDLVSTDVFPELGKTSQEQIERLNWLIGQAGRVGIGVYLYLNEPRGMPEEFFSRYPEIKGQASKDGLFSLCTSTERVQNYLVTASRRLFELAPQLAGLILITASENPTNCYSHRRDISCPRCRLRQPAEVIGEVVTLISRGARQANPSARVIAWDWSWTLAEDDPQEGIIRALPEEATLMVDFERGTSINRSGVRHVVNEYSLSVVGPSPRAVAHLELARRRGLARMAKIQLGTSWECGSIPFIPVLQLLARKFEMMLQNGIEGAMESWTLGSCPSVNAEVAREFYWSRDAAAETVLPRVASRRYGKKAAPLVVEAWQIFSTAFQDYPFSNPLVYSSQAAYGPAHPFYFFKTGRAASLQNTPDTLTWTQPFGPEIAAAHFETIATAWAGGVDLWKNALEQVELERRREQAERDLAVARALQLYFQSIANQIRFLMLRDAPADSAPPAQSLRRLSAMKRIVENELALTAEFYRICRADSRIGFEAFFQYIYRPQDILEKIVACRYILDRLIPEKERAIA